MPTCCIVKCDSNKHEKPPDFSIHRFPTEPSLRSAWLKALDKEGWEPRERSAVCSAHFLTDDLYITKSGLRKVRAGAVPVVMQNTPRSDYLTTTTPSPCPSDVKVCRICFATDCRLYPMTVYKNLEQAYEILTGFSIENEDNLPPYLCSECAHRLLNYINFRTRSLRAHTILLEIYRKHDCITLGTIKSINRKQNQLTSSLGVSHRPPDHYDLQMCEDTGDDFTEDQTDINALPLHEVTVTELDGIKCEKDDFQDVFTESLNNEDNNEDVVSVCEDTLVGKDYSSDDSLPLGQTQKTKRKPRKVKKVDKEPKPSEPKIDRRRKPFLNDDLNETLFTISDLTVEEQVAEIEKRRETANYKNSAFKCTVCYKGFLDSAAFSGHMMRHSNACGEYECKICKTHFKHPHALRKHITAHHTQRFSCNQCPYVTTHRQTARLHERWHKGTKYSCPHCQEEFLKFTTYMGHIRIKHPSDFVCQLCGYSFVSQKGIELHKKLKHRLENTQIPEDGPFCELCNVRFVSAEAHARHLSVSAKHDAADKQKEPNQPKQCKLYKSRAPPRNTRKYDRYSAPADQPGPIPCEQCGLQLEDSRAYHGHFRRMHPDKNRTNYPSMKSPCMCEVCGRMFQSHALLKDHRWVHTGERPFACDACPKRFRMRQRLVAHRRVHSAARAAYPCSLCGKTFSTHSNRQRHMFIHTGLKPFKCEMCGKPFKHASEKRAHITYVHLKKPWPKRARGKRRDTQHRQSPAQAEGVVSASEMDAAQPWPPCDPKMADLSMIDKPVYYNLKI